MALQFLLPLFASVLQGAMAHGLAENARAREGNQQAALFRRRREELQPLIDRLNEARDYFDLDEQFVRDFSRASNQLTAQSASTGMMNAGTGGLDHVRGDLMASGLAELALAKQQDDARRQELLAQLLSDPSLYAGDVPDENVAGATALGALLGGVTGAGSNLASYFSTEAGMKNLASWLGGGQQAPDLNNVDLSTIFGAGGIQNQAAVGTNRSQLAAPRAPYVGPSRNYYNLGLGMGLAR